MTLPTTRTSKATVPDVDPYSWLPERPAVFRYDGSRTSPPCTEGVTWIVFADPVPMSRVVLDRIRKATGDTARPVRSGTGRGVLTGDFVVAGAPAPSMSSGTPADTESGTGHGAAPAQAHGESAAPAAAETPAPGGEGGHGGGH